MRRKNKSVVIILKRVVEFSCFQTNTGWGSDGGADRRAAALSHPLLLVTRA